MSFPTKGRILNSHFSTKVQMLNARFSFPGKNRQKSDPPGLRPKTKFSMAPHQYCAAKFAFITILCSQICFYQKVDAKFVFTKNAVPNFFTF